MNLSSNIGTGSPIKSTSSRALESGLVCINSLSDHHSGLESIFDIKLGSITRSLVRYLTYGCRGAAEQGRIHIGIVTRQAYYFYGPAVGDKVNRKIVVEVVDRVATFYNLIGDVP